MNTARQLNWKSDLAGLFPHVEKCVNEHAMLLVAYMVMSVFSALIQGASVIAGIVAMLIFLVLACHLVRQVWAASADAEMSAESKFGQVGAPIVSLAFLQIIYWVVTLLLAGLLVIPGLWWMAKSSLAMAILVIEDVGAIEALKRSHKILDGRLMEAMKYLLPLNLATSLPCILLILSLDSCWNFLLTRSLSLPIVLGAKVVIFLLKAVTTFLAQMLIAGCLVYLYRHFKVAEPKPVVVHVEGPSSESLLPFDDDPEAGEPTGM